MKKFFAFLLAAMMLLSFASVAIAEDGDEVNQQPSAKTYTDIEAIKLTKKIEATTGTTPAATYTFTITAQDDAPAFTPNTITYAMAADAKSLEQTVSLPTYNKVGIYVYTIKETAGTTPGVVYDSNTYYLKVTVIDDQGTLKRQAAKLYVNQLGTDGSNKVDYFSNAYNSGSLTVNKTVATNTETKAADEEREFNFKVTFSGLNSNVTYSAKVGTTTYTFANGENAFKLKHGQSITISNLPYGTTYAVDEVAGTYDNNCTVTEAHTGNESGTISADSPNPTVAYTNTFDYRGSLTIKKAVEGLGGDKNTAEWNFTLTFTGADDGIVLGDNGTKNDNGTITFKLKHNESFTVSKIPYAATWTVVETEANTDGYTTTYEDNGTGTINAETKTCTITNTKGMNVDTGVSLDTLPYVLMLAVVAAGVVAMIAKKRRVED